MLKENKIPLMTLINEKNKLYFDLKHQEYSKTHLQSSHVRSFLEPFEENYKRVSLYIHLNHCVKCYLNALQIVVIN